MELKIFSQSPRLGVVSIILVLLASAGSAAARPLVIETPANVFVELTFTAAQNYQDPFNEVTLDAIFLEPKGRELRVPAFWAGGKVWKIRYASPTLGIHSFRTECSAAGDKGLQDIRGKVAVRPYQGENLFFTHGPIQVAEDHRHFEHADGTPFFWLGDTWWMGLSHRLHWPEDVQKLAQDRKAKGFNVIQLVAGLFPDMHPFDPRGANEAGYPWETNYTSIRPEYFDAADKRLTYMVDQGFAPCIVGAWGYFLPWMGVEKAKAHWRYLVARYGAMPVVWCTAGEANLPWYLAKGFPYDDRKQVEGWTEVTRYLRATDPFHRPITIHPTGLGRLSARNAMNDLSLIDFDMLQTPHGRRDAVAPTVHTVRESYADKPMMPVINGEASFEMLSDNLPTEWTRRMFWLCMMNGAAGHTYGANGIWQNNRKGDPHGPSPTAGSPPTGYGAISWDDAMNLPGSEQVAFGKKLLTEFSWWKFTPHPEWAEFADKSSLSLEGADWIWFPEGNPARNAPAEKRYFRREIIVPDGKSVTQARLRILVDDRFSASLNGKNLGSSVDWKAGKQFNNLASSFKSGTNVLAIEAENLPFAGENPAGLLANCEIRFSTGETVRFLSDTNWYSSKHAGSGWDKGGFDGSGWAPALAMVRYGGSPWGKVDEAGTDDVYGPQSTGIPGVVRITYVPDAKPVTLKNLGRNTRYNAECFDPVTGGKTALAGFEANGVGSCKVEPPTGNDHDWVIILKEQPPLKKKGPLSTKQLTIANKDVAWSFDWSEDDHLRTVAIENKRSGHGLAVSKVEELGLTFSAALESVAQPFSRVTDFRVREARRETPTQVVFDLESATIPLRVALHVKLDGPTRRKWAEVTNQSGKEVLLLDVDLDDFTSEGKATGGGEGQPVYVEGEIFAAIEHPAGVNEGSGGRVHLAHYPGKRIAPNESFRTHVSLVSVAGSGQATAQFSSYIQSKSLRPKRDVSIYTPLGINNLWGPCPTLDDEETLDVLNVLEKWQKHGMRFDYFTLDLGWVDPASDLTRFRPTCYPNGPEKMIGRVKELGMKFGLWFATSWGTQSAWDYPPAFPNSTPPGQQWREGSPLGREGITFCIGTEQYHQMLKHAVLHHIRENQVRLFKFDGGDYVCDHTEHGHLPGKYSVEPRFANLIDIATAARAAAPDVFIMWYWGLRSPFWALYGDTLFESGLHMEGSATSVYPALYYRDSVSLAQDQNAHYAVNIPPIVKDSLGVWLADDRWGNFMGKQRWREAMVMDLGRGNLFVPNLWGDIYLFNDADVDFLARITDVAKRNSPLLLQRRNILGDPFLNQVYGYAYCQDRRGLLFLNNADFTSRRAEIRLDESIGLGSKSGTLDIISEFPEQARLLRPDGEGYKAGDVLQIWLRPFETLMLRLNAAQAGAGRLPLRSISDKQAADLGIPLKLQPQSLDARMDLRFADAGKFEAQKFKKKTYAFEAKLPEFKGKEQPILAISIRLKKGKDEWRYKPTVVQIVQALARVSDQNVQLIPVPDSRQYGNTQAEGCSWLVYKLRLSSLWSQKNLKLAIHAYLPDDVEPQIESWTVKRWWQEDSRPSSDGYYTDEPS